MKILISVNKFGADEPATAPMLCSAFDAPNGLYFSVVLTEECHSMCFVMVIVMLCYVYYNI